MMSVMTSSVGTRPSGNSISGFSRSSLRWPNDMVAPSAGGTWVFALLLYAVALLDAEDVDDEREVALGVTLAGIAVGEVLRNDQQDTRADRLAGQALGPALDDLVQGE